MGNQFQSMEERIYMGLEATYGLIPAAKPAATDAVRNVRFSLNNEPLNIPRPDKTGSRGTTVGAKGRKSCRWDFQASLTGSGTAGTAPRLDPLFQCAFGAAPVVVAATKVTYNLADTIKSMWAASYRAAGATQRIGHGLLVYQMGITLGQDVASISASGEGQWVVESDQIPNLNAEQLGGLVTFPVEPTPTYADAGLVIGFTGEVKIHGATMANIRNMNFSFNTGTACRRDTFGRFTPDGAEGGRRSVAVSFEVYDEDGAETNYLREAANGQLPVDVIGTLGLDAGNIFKSTLKNVQLASQTLGDGSLRWTASHGQSQAHETTAGAKDEYQLELT